MRNFYSWLAICAIIAAPAAFGQNLNVRLGLWETTTTVQSNGQIPIDTSKMTPEQRTRVEAAMKKSMARLAQPHTEKSCVTKETLAESFSKGMPESCKRNIISNSGNKLEVKVSCDGKAGGNDTDLLIEALSKESIKVTSHTTMNSNGRSVTMTTNGTGKWISDSCGDVK